MSHWRQENEGDNEVALRRYVEIMLHWWWLFLIVPVAVLPMLLSKGSAEPVVRYETNTRILIQSVGSGLSDLLANQRLPQLYVELVTERDMLEEVREELGLSDSMETMQGWISAIVVPGTSILELQVTHTDPVVGRRWPTSWRRCSSSGRRSGGWRRWDGCRRWRGRWGWWRTGRS